jgi:hypothetical protein
VFPRSCCAGVASLTPASLAFGFTDSLSIERAAGVAGVDPRFCALSSVLSVDFGVPLLRRVSD